MNLFLKRISTLIFTLVIFLFLAQSSFAAQGSWTNLGLNSFTIYSVTVDPNNNNVIYAGTVNNGIYKSIDKGTTWNPIDNGISNYSGIVTDIVVDPNNSNNVYAVGAGFTLGVPAIYKSTDAGANWVLSNTGITDVGFGGPPLDVFSLAIDPVNTNNLFAAIGTRCGSVYKSSDSGATWTRGIGLACDPTVVRIDPTNPSVLYTRTSWGQGFDVSTDGGINWTNVSGFGKDTVLAALTIDPFNTNILYATGDNGNNGIYKSMDGGASWNLSYSVNTVNWALTADPVRPDTVYFGQHLFGSSGVSVTTNGGTTWTDMTGDLPHYSVVRLLVPKNDTDLLYAATEGGLYVYGLTPTQTTPQLTVLDPAKVWVGLKNSDDVGVKFDLKAEAYVNGNLISTGETDTVLAGSSGFNNAKLDTINFSSFSPVNFPSGSTLSIKLYVRNACTGSGHNSGVARLWYNDSAANSRFGATIDTGNTYYLVSSAALSTSVGSGPKQTVDVQSGAKCSAFKTFGTWNITP